MVEQSLFDLVGRPFLLSTIKRNRIQDMVEYRIRAPTFENFCVKYGKMCSECKTWFSTVHSFWLQYGHTCPGVAIPAAKLSIEVALFPGLPTIQFFIACSIHKTKGEGLGTRLALKYIA